NKTESPYTVDAGHLQVETDFLTYTKDRDSKEEALETRQSFLVSNLKVGLTANLDFQVSLSPYDIEKSRLGGKREEGRGFGDTVVRFKYNFLGNDEGPIALALMPFLKIPTAHEILERNSRAEVGIIFPIALKLPHEMDLGLMFQLNRAQNENLDGVHAALISSATLEHKILGDLSGYLEFYGEASAEEEAGWIATGDAGFVYELSPTLHVDAGVAVGLTAAADDFNGFSGFSVRF
ncbi:MAG: transporter, partial [Proteobacteria bacterium]